MGGISMANSTRKAKPRKDLPPKPHPDFPLTAHRNGQWCKKVRGKIHYFGLLADHQKALDAWIAQKDDLLAGRKPREKGRSGDGLADLVNAYLTHKEAILEAGELTPRTFADAHRTCARLLVQFGKDRLVSDLRQDDFAALRDSLSKVLGPVALGNAIQRIRSVFKYAFETGLISAPLVFGPGFKRPSKKTLRLERVRRGPRMFEQTELQKVLALAKTPMRAMILLGLNAGLGNSDLANLPLKAINLENGWVNYPRPKTGIARRFPLWAETIEALKEAIAARPAPREPEDEGIVFITKYGGRWYKSIFEQIPDTEGKGEAKFRDYSDSAITKAFAKLLKAAGIEQRSGRGFYALRHVFETVAGESRDQIAVDHIMGHADSSMAGVYRERIGDDRLSAVVEHVRGWLFVSEK